MLRLRQDPNSLAPDRVIVFEVAGTIQNFLKAVKKIPGLEFIAEYESEFEPDTDFAVEDRRSGRQGLPREDRPVTGRLYLAMPDTRALEELLSLWEQWQREGRLRRGFAPFTQLFGQLRDLRPWGPADRIPPDTVLFWQEEIGREPNKPVRTEVELCYRESGAMRIKASQAVRTVVEASGGSVIHESVISEIAYHGMLVDIPASDVENLLAGGHVALAINDDVMFLRPQSLLRGPLDIEPEPGGVASRAATRAWR
jgi:hypothetical protein